MSDIIANQLLAKVNKNEPMYNEIKDKIDNLTFFFVEKIHSFSNEIINDIFVEISEKVINFI